MRQKSDTSTEAVERLVTHEAENATFRAQLDAAEQHVKILREQMATVPQQLLDQRSAGYGEGQASVAKELAAVKAEMWREVAVEVNTVAAWIRVPGNINVDDVRDECARVVESLGRACEARVVEEGK